MQTKLLTSSLIHFVQDIKGNLEISMIKKIKVTINWKNTDDKCIQYAVTAVLNYEEHNISIFLFSTKMYLLLIILFTIKLYAHIIDIFKIVKRKDGQE